MRKVVIELEDDEPYFVLRGQDDSAPAIIALWISLNPRIPPDKRLSAEKTMDTFRAYPRKKRPD